MIMSLADLDVNFIKSISSLHSKEFLLTGEPSVLQLSLQEAIKAKTGVTKDFTALIATSVKQQRLDELKSNIVIEDSKTSSSDNELELDLLKEDLNCVVCNGMDVGARNRLLECSDCHALYHQECHTPVVTSQESDENWVCHNCKMHDSKRIKLSPSASPSPMPSVPSISKPVIAKTASTTTTTTTIMHPSSSVTATGIAGPYSSIKHVPSKTSTGIPPRASVTPNINIISVVDKRIQIMKKKAAKQQQEKRSKPVPR